MSINGQKDDNDLSFKVMEAILKKGSQFFLNYGQKVEIE